MLVFESTSNNAVRADYALVTDKKFKEIVKKYAEDEHVFFKE